MAQQVVRNHCGFSAEDVTILASHFFKSKKATVLDYKIEPFSKERLGYLGVHEALIIWAVGRRKNNVKQITFFVKSVASTCNNFDRAIFAEEVNFLGKIVPLMPKYAKSEEFWSSKCYLARSDLIVLENLIDRGYQVVTSELQPYHLRAAMVTIARFHAFSVLLEFKFGKPLIEMYPDYLKEKIYLNDYSLPGMWLKTGMDVAKTVADKLGINVSTIDEAYNHLFEVAVYTKSKFKVICHSDLWSNNMMFKNEIQGSIASCKLIDFQMVSYNSNAVDLVQFLYLNMSHCMRQAMEPELIGIYYNELNRQLQNADVKLSTYLTRNELFRDIDELRIYGLVAAMQYFPIASLSQEHAQKFSQDPKTLERHMYCNRTDFTIDVMSIDENYKKKVIDSVLEVCEFMEQRFKYIEAMHHFR